MSALDVRPPLPVAHRQASCRYICCNSHLTSLAWRAVLQETIRRNVELCLQKPSQSTRKADTDDAREVRNRLRRLAWAVGLCLRPFLLV